jgi:hypothetical protein
MSRHDPDEADRHAEELARKVARDAFLDAVALNNDAPLPRMGFEAVRASVFLGECSREAQGLLFAACHEARVNDGEDRLAAACLRSFVEQVADEYSDDHWEAWL